MKVNGEMSVSSALFFLAVFLVVEGFRRRRYPARINPAHRIPSNLPLPLRPLNVEGRRFRKEARRSAIFVGFIFLAVFLISDYFSH